MLSLMCSWRIRDQRSSTQSFRRKHIQTDTSTLTQTTWPGSKRGIIQCLRHRAEKVCNGCMQWPEIRHLRQVFKANSYSKTMVKRNLRALPTPTNFSQTSQPAPKLLLLPYVPGLSKRIKRVYRPLGVKTICRSRGTLRTALVRVKQPKEDRKKKGVIYEVPCKDCE